MSNDSPPALAETDDEAPRAVQPPVSAHFADFGLRRELLEAIEEIGWEQPTEVQVAAIPLALEGRDLVVQSRTGSGKTAAFVLPISQSSIDPALDQVQALVLCPTRELAIQVADEFRRLMKHTPIKTTAIYGGAPMAPQIDALKGQTHVIAGTPGRVLDHLRRGTFKADGVRVLVLDEADEMLSMGFLEEINAIIERLPKERQSLLFSATIPDDLQRLTERYLDRPERLILSDDFIGVREIHHVYYMISGGDRHKDLLRVIDYENPTLALVFCNTRNDTAHVAEFLERQGYKAEGISSDLTQRDRERVMQRMRDGKLRFLVATDIAARGIDISDISHVINYSFPESADVYVHRTGRTGRAGKSGVAISLVSPREIGSFYYLRLIHKIYPEERHLPSPEELATRREAERFEALASRYDGRSAGPEERSLARRVWSTADGENLIALALSEVLEAPAEAQHSARSSGETRVAPRRTRRAEGRDRGGDRGGDRGERREGRERRDRREGRMRKTTRTRSAVPEGPEGESYTTADGEVEYFETLDPEATTGRGEARGGGRAERDDDMVRLYVNIGRKHGARASELSDYLKAEGELEGPQLGRVLMRDRHTFVHVAPEQADALIARLEGKSFQDRPIKVERARN